MIGLPTQMGGWGQRSFSTPAASAMPAFSGVATATRNPGGGYTQNPDTWGSALQSGGQFRGFGDAYPSMPPGMAWGGAATMFRPQQPSPAAMGGPTGAASAPSGGFPSTAPMARGRSMMPPPMTAGSSGPIRNTMGLSPFMPRGDGASHAQPVASPQPSSTPGKMLPNPYGGASGASQSNSFTPGGNTYATMNAGALTGGLNGWTVQNNQGQEVPFNQAVGQGYNLQSAGFSPQNIAEINAYQQSGGNPWAGWTPAQPSSFTPNPTNLPGSQNNAGIRPSNTPWLSV